MVIFQISRRRTLRAYAMEPGRDLNLHPSFMRVPCLPPSREREKRLGGGGRAKNADVPPFFSYIVIYVSYIIKNKIKCQLLV